MKKFNQFAVLSTIAVVGVLCGCASSKTADSGYTYREGAGGATTIRTNDEMTPEGKAQVQELKGIMTEEERRKLEGPSTSQ